MRTYTETGPCGAVIRVVRLSQAEAMALPSLVYQARPRGRSDEAAGMVVIVDGEAAPEQPGHEAVEPGPEVKL